MPMPLDINSTTVAQMIANISGQSLVEITKQFNDVVGSTPTDAFMDAARGFGHRVVHGHSLDNLPYIFEKFGLTGVKDYTIHGIRDTMSPDGMPIPYANSLGDLFGATMFTKVHWLCANIGDLLSGTFSIGSSVILRNTIQTAIANGSLPLPLLITASIGALVKLTIGISTTNAVSILSGTYDIGMLAWASYNVPIGDLPNFLKITAAPKPQSKLWSFAQGGLIGAATASAIGGALHFTTEKDRSLLSDRIKKMAIAGAIGGVTGVAVSTVTAVTAAIASGAIGGYIATEWAYENRAILTDKIRNIGNSVKSSISPANDFEVVPDFLCAQ